jgi:hypothetical protein
VLAESHILGWNDWLRPEISEFGARQVQAPSYTDVLWWCSSSPVLNSYRGIFVVGDAAGEKIADPALHLICWSSSTMCAVLYLPPVFTVVLLSINTWTAISFWRHGSGSRFTLHASWIHSGVNLFEWAVVFLNISLQSVYSVVSHEARIRFIASYLLKKSLYSLIPLSVSSTAALASLTLRKNTSCTLSHVYIRKVFWSTLHMKLNAQGNLSQRTSP